MTSSTARPRPLYEHVLSWNKFPINSGLIMTISQFRNTVDTGYKNTIRTRHIPYLLEQSPPSSVDYFSHLLE